MKKRLFVLAGLVLVLAIMGIASLLFRNKPKTTCLAFLTNIQEGKVTESYEMLTDHAKTFATPAEWAKQAAIVKADYGGQKPVSLGGLAPITDSITKQVTGYRDEYGVQYGEVKYKAVCTTTAAEPDKIDSFSSLPRY